MMDIASVRHHFEEFNNVLKSEDLVAEVCACGGKAFLAGYYTEKNTRDISEIFRPTELVLDAWSRVERRFGLEAKGIENHLNLFFHPDPPRERHFSMSHLRVFASTPAYLLAMKCSTPCPDIMDQQAIQFLIQYLKIESVEQILEIISDYYPRLEVPENIKSTIKRSFNFKKS